MTDGGEIRVATQLAADPEQPGTRTSRHIVLTVSDNGSGMTPEVLGRAFEPFFTTKPAERGSGLGLATVHAIVARAEGHISVESAVGVGTTIRIRLSNVAVPQQLAKRSA